MNLYVVMTEQEETAVEGIFLTRDEAIKVVSDLRLRFPGQQFWYRMVPVSMMVKDAVTHSTT